MASAGCNSEYAVTSADRLSRRSVGEIAWHVELLAQPGGIDPSLAIGGEEVRLVLELPQQCLQVQPLPASCGLPGRSAEQRGDLLIEPEPLPAFGRGRTAALDGALPGRSGAVLRRADPLLGGNYRVAADFPE